MDPPLTIIVPFQSMCRMDFVKTIPTPLPSRMRDFRVLQTTMTTMRTIWSLQKKRRTRTK